MTSQRQLAAIMFTDIAGYTSLMGKDTERTLELVRLSKKIQKPLVEKYHGKWIKEMGDGALAQFNTALDAVNCAIEIQRVSRADFEAELRIGIHLGDITIESDDVFGDGVNVAARLESIADPGGIYLSNAVFQAIQGQSEVKTAFLGEVELKNVAYAVRTYALQGVGLPKPQFKANTLIKSRATKTKYTMVAALALAVVGLFFVYLYPHLIGDKAGETNPDVLSTITSTRVIDKTVAVLPFADMSPNGDQEWFSDGMMEEILNSLVQIEDLKVISRTTAMRYKGSDKSLRKIGKELGVAHILEGSVRRLGDQLRITVQLIDVESDLHLWSENYDRTMEDVFAIQSEVAQQIAATLQADINPEVRLRIESQPTSSTEAYELYLMATSNWRNFSRAAREKSGELLEEAIRIDPEYADAYAFLGLQNGMFAWDGTSDLTSPQQAFELGRPYIEKALEIDPDNTQAHLFKAWHYLWYKWDFETAEKEFNTLDELLPNFSWADYLITSGQFEKAVDRAEKETESNPLSSESWTQKVLSYGFANDKNQALETIETALSSTTFYDADLMATIARVYLYIAMYAQAAQMSERFALEYQAFRHAPRPLAVHAIALLHLGERHKVNEILEILKSRNEETSSGSPSFFTAMIYTQMGEIDTAFDWLEKSYEDHEVEMYWLKVEPLFEPLRSDPRYQEMLEKVGFPEFDEGI